MERRRKEGIHARQSPHVQISEEEHLKEIPVSGQKPQASSTPRASQENVDEEEGYPLAEEIFAATTLLIPMSFLLLMMYM